MRKESKEIPEDPYLVLPRNLGSSHEIKKSHGLHFDDSVDALTPIMRDIDFVGIWVNGKMFRGNANNLGQRHWFETESHCLDYSLVSSSHQMVKGCLLETIGTKVMRYVNDGKKLEIMNRKPVQKRENTELGLKQRCS